MYMYYITYVPQNATRLWITIANKGVLALPKLPYSVQFRLTNIIRYDYRYQQTQYAFYLFLHRLPAYRQLY